MSGLFGTFNVAVKGLNANQTALHTTSHNISNANTEGFNRQRVELKADTPYNLAGVGQLGTGVKLESVVRMVDEFVGYQMRKENSSLEQYNNQFDVMGQIEMIFNEPSTTGLNFAMGEMFNAWQELSKNPESLNAQSIVAEKSKTFADTLNHMSIQANELKGDVATTIGKNIFDANTIIDQLNTVNDQIFNISVKGQSPNDLMDSRDLLLNKLSGLTEIKETYDKWGRVSVEIAGKTVTGKDSTSKLSNITEIKNNGDGTYSVFGHEGGDSSKVFEVKDLTLDQVQDLKPGMPVMLETGSNSIASAGIKSGAIGGNLNAMKEIDERISDLDAFAKGTAYMVNQIHGGEEGVDFFNFDGSETAMNFRVSEQILTDESKVATGKDALSAVGDGSRALAIAKLRTTKIDFKTLTNNVYNAGEMKFDNQPGGTTMEGAYSDIIIKVGIKTEHASNMVDNQSAVMAQLSNRRESVSGVSIDEEVTNLLKYQRSYEANSRVINTLNEMLDTLINRTGV